MRCFIARYVLHSGGRGSMTVVASSSCAAVVAMLDALGVDIRRLSVRPA